MTDEIAVHPLAVRFEFSADELRQAETEGASLLEARLAELAQLERAEPLDANTSLLLFGRTTMLTSEVTRLRKLGTKLDVEGLAPFADSRAADPIVIVRIPPNYSSP